MATDKSAPSAYGNEEQQEGEERPECKRLRRARMHHVKLIINPPLSWYHVAPFPFPHARASLSTHLLPL
jgi:hypothetical protein